MKRTLVAILLFICAGFCIAFSILNFNTVSVNYFFGQVKAPLAVLINGGIILGVLLGLLLNAVLLLKLRAHIRKLEQQAAQARAELKRLRNLPLKDLA